MKYKKKKERTKMVAFLCVSSLTFSIASILSWFGEGDGSLWGSAGDLGTRVAKGTSQDTANYQLKLKILFISFIIMKLPVYLG